MTTATNLPAAQLQGVRSWVDAPYHRLPLMDANTRHIGCSASQRVVGGRTYAAEVLEMAASWKDTTRRITVYPANGQTGVPTTFNRCQEHPTPFGGPCDRTHPVQNVGYVVTLQADGYYALKIQGIGFSRGSSGSPVAIHRAGERPAGDPDQGLEHDPAMHLGGAGHPLGECDRRGAHPLQVPVEGALQDQQAVGRLEQAASGGCPMLGLRLPDQVQPLLEPSGLGPACAGEQVSRRRQVTLDQPGLAPVLPGDHGPPRR